MTAEEMTQQEKDVLHEAHVAARNVEAQRAKLAAIGEHLVELGEALQRHPEFVTPLPEVGSRYDYKTALNELDRKKVIELCDELKTLERKKRAIEDRKAKLRL